MNQVEAKAGIIQAWLKRPVNARLEADVHAFYDELAATRSALLSFTGSEDKYERVKVWLLPHITG